MRRVDENRAENFIKKHQNHKKWIAFALCVALLTGTGTLYMLNKPATAMTEEGAQSVGLVLETADTEFEQGLIEQMESGETSGDEESAAEETASEESISEENSEEEMTEDSEEETAETDAEEAEDSEEGKEKAEAEEDKDADKKSDKIIKSDEEKELTEDVVLIANYVDQNGEVIADERQMKISESFDPASEASEIEGYTFRDASIDGVVVTLIAAKHDEDTECKYFEVTTESGETVEIKEDKTVVLTYLSDEAKEEEAEEEKTEAKKSIVLTAKYVDKNGEEIQEAEEISFDEEKELTKDNAKELEGYFYRNASFEDQEIVKIAPVIREGEVTEEVKESKKNSDDAEESEVKEDSEESKDSEKSEKAETNNTEAKEPEKSDESENEAKTVSVEGYVVTTAEGETIEITEDAEIAFNYLKASEETEFTFSDSKITVKATVNAKNVFPEGIELKAKEVTKNSSDYNYDAYMGALNNNAESIAKAAGQDDANEFTEDNTLLYDIAFTYEGKEIQPKEGAVSVSIEFKKNQLSEDLSASSEEDITVVHLPIKDEVKEENDITNTEDATGISSGDVDVITLTEATANVEDREKVEFEAESFSVFAITATDQLVVQKVDIDYDFVRSFGEAYDYGVVANTYNWAGDTESNMMVGTYSASAKELGASSRYSNAGGNNYFGKIIYASENKLAFYQPPANVYLGPEAYAQWKGKQFSLVTSSNDKQSVEDLGTNVELNTSINVSKIINSVGNYYSQYKNLTQKSFTAKDRDSGGTVIDLTNREAGTYVMNFEGTIIDNKNALKINIREDQHLILNCTASSLTVDQYTLNDKVSTSWVTSEEPERDWITTAVIFNISSSDVAINQTCGVFIAPNSNVTMNSTSGGILIANSVTGTGGEWHYHNHNLPSVYGTEVTLEASKTVDGSEPADDEIFTFELTEWNSGNNAWSETLFDSVQNSKGSITFKPIQYGSYDDLGVHYYRIVEKNEGNSKYTYDEKVYVAKVVVSQNTVQVNGSYETRYTATEPKYYELSDKDANPASATTELSSKPTFNNRNARRAIIKKVWEGKEKDKILVYICPRAYRNGSGVNNDALQKEIADKLCALIGDNGENGVFELSSSNNWTCSFSIPADRYTYNNVTYDLIYRVTEIDDSGKFVYNDKADYSKIEADGYIVSYFSTVGTAYEGDTGNHRIVYKTGQTEDATVTITNTNNTTDVVVKKVWGFAGDEYSKEFGFDIGIQLVRKLEGQDDSQYVNVDGKFKTLEKGNEDGVKFENLQLTDGNGTKYVYSARELVDGKLLQIGDTANSFKLKSIESSETEDGTVVTIRNVSVIEIEKVFSEGGKELSVEEAKAKQKGAVIVKLYQSSRMGVTDAIEGIPNPIILSADNDWHAEFEITRGYHPARQSAKQYQYYIVEYDEYGNEVQNFVTYYAYIDDNQVGFGNVGKDVMVSCNEKSGTALKLKVVNEQSTYVLPQTGGVGDIPYLASGVGIALAGLLGGTVYSKKKKKDREEE